MMNGEVRLGTVTQCQWHSLAGRRGRAARLGQAVVQPLYTNGNRDVEMPLA